MVMKHYACHIMFVLLAAAMASGAAEAAVQIEAETAGLSYNPGDEYLDTNLTVIYDEFMPKDDAVLYVYMDNDTGPMGQASLEGYLHEEGYYTFRNQSFRYVITSDGMLQWEEYPDQDFEYMVSVGGLCGGDFCKVGEVYMCQCPDPCTPTGSDPYPCTFSITRSTWDTATVNGDPYDSGLYLIEEVGFSQYDFVNGSVSWNVAKSGTSPEEVDLTMREVCGRPPSVYDGQGVWPDGWIIRTIGKTGYAPCIEMSGFDCRIEIMPFDGSSLEGGKMFGGPGWVFNESGGGVYKDGVYQEEGSGVTWDGQSGEVVIKNYNQNSDYKMAYLPPNGHMVCAYTSHSVTNSSGWESSQEITGPSTGYMQPYVRTFTTSELLSMSGLSPPECPWYVDPLDCESSRDGYGASESYDPGGSVNVSYYYDGDSLTVTGTSDVLMLSSEEWFMIDLMPFAINISGMTQEEGSHNMTVVISDGSREYARESFDVFVCTDDDRDGYCTENGDCDDDTSDDPDTCPDSPHNCGTTTSGCAICINPNATEICNGIDDDCDGETDEGIAGMGEQLGKPCWDWSGSVCGGTYVCNSEGTNLTCLPDNGIYPGQMEEICNNYRDDDCDNIVDEKGLVIDGVTQTCVDQEDTQYCYAGETRACGQCKDGIRRCINGQWGQCEGSTEPQVETCNRIDDDCDGVVDNLYGKDSEEETKCKCYGGEWPGVERCNGIDDDCDGEIDEGTSNCCTDGDTMACGTDTGACVGGVRTCSDGTWGDCEGSVDPSEEACCNALDDDCDGEIDEDCSELECGSPEEVTMLYWTMIGIGVVMLICVVIYTQFMRKGPAPS